MECENNELMNLAKVWLSVFVSLTYCFYITKIIPKGTFRFLSLLPILSLFFFLPLKLSSVHFSGITGFFISWLANFKLFLLAFGKGPLTSNSLSLPRFLALACLPIKITQNHNKHKVSQIQSDSNSKCFDQNGKKTLNPITDLSSESKRFAQNGKKTLNPNPPFTDPSSDTKRFDQNGKTLNPVLQDSSEKSRDSNLQLLRYAIKGTLLAVIVKVYDYNDYIHPNLILCMYSLHIYFFLELSLAVFAATARAVLGLELEPQFNEPFLSTSLQDFWGRRWNLMVSSILRPTVYEPTLNVAGKVVGARWAPLPAVVGTFVVSAAMHELIMYYMGRMKPSFRMTWFFLLHGFCLTAEIAIKRAVNGRWRLPRIVSGPMTAGFVIATAFWLFLPEFIRCRADVRAFEEYAALGAFVKNVSKL